MQTFSPVKRGGLVLACAITLATCVTAAELFSNGPIVTNPTGGTGNIAGLPISQADGFTIPGSSFIYSTTGTNATVAINTAIAEDFVVPDGGWDLDTLTVFAFQTSQTTPTVTSIQINLWNATPYSVDSPPPVPDPVPVPLLATPLELPAGDGTFVCHRQSPSGTSSNRPVYAYTVSLDGLPNGGVLAPGTYWMQWSFVGASSPSQNVFTPLVTPRDAAFNLNARLFNSIDGSSGGPRTWFEGREGYVAGVTDGRPYALPFVLGGTVVPEPATALLLLAGLLLRRR